MECISCNKNIYQNSRYCFHCGTKLSVRKASTKGRLQSFELNGKWGFKEKSSNETIIIPKYDQAGTFHDDRAFVKKGSKYAYIDNEGNQITPFKYDYAGNFKREFAKVGIKNKYTFLTKSGLELTQIDYEDITEFKSGISVVFKNLKCGLLNLNGERITPIKYDFINEHSENIFVATIYDKQIVINTSSGNSTGLASEINILGHHDIYLLAKENNIWRQYDKNIKLILGSIKNVKTDISQTGKSNKDSTNKYEYKSVTISDIKDSDHNIIKRNVSGILVLIILLAIIIISSIFILKPKDNYHPGGSKDSIVLREVQDWNHAIQVNSIPEYEAFINNYPNSEYVSEARRNIEDLEFEDARRIGNISAFGAFLSEYPNSSHNRQIEEILILNADRTNTIVSYSYYLSIFPNGRHASYARNRIRDLEWEEVVELDRIEQYTAFINRYPDDNRVAEAEARIDLLMWYEARREHTIEAYEFYISNTPTDDHIPEANEAIREIRDWHEYRDRINSGAGVIVLGGIFGQGERSGTFSFRELNQNNVTGRYTFRYNIEERVIGANRCTIRINCRIYHYSETILFEGRIRDLPSVLSRQCGPVIFRYYPTSRQFQIIQHSWL